MNRKNFIRNVAASTGGLIAMPFFSPSQNEPKPGPLPNEKVKDFVIAGHSNLDRVKQLLVEFPTLLYSTWDWGGGDFETGLEGAGHVGNKEIANYLIGSGARTNLFVLTMLGKTQIVKAYMEAYPQYLQARGPHGLTLLHHAEQGGEDARELVEYLTSKGLKEKKAQL